MPVFRNPYLYLSLIVGTILLLSLFALWQIDALLTMAGTSDEIREKEVTIPLGSSTAQVAAILEEEGVIASATLFRLYARYSGADQNFQAGSYLFTGGMSLEEIVQTLQGGVVYQEGIRFTIPEGFNVEEMASRLEEYGLVETEEFLGLCREYENPAYSFLEEIPAETYYKLEGYLFPDTYEVSEGISAEDIIEIMLGRFDRVFDDEFRARAEELGFSVHQVVTLASLVEKEGRVEDEMPLIAAVFYNRLFSDNLPYLQSCATVQYVLGEVKLQLTYQDLEVESLYNTYLYPDLPPGPIASPGLKTLKASLYPAEADYLYFVYREDGTGKHYFSETLQEHSYHRELAQRNRNSVD